MFQRIDAVCPVILGLIDQGRYVMGFHSSDGNGAKTAAMSASRVLSRGSLKKAWGLPLIPAAMLSTCVEFLQVYTHSRFPSTTDICANLLGAILGLTLQRW
jgi:hypothetical protein